MLSRSDIVLVTGGTGFTGRVLLRMLCEQGCQVRVIVRSTSDRSGLEGLPIDWFEGEVFDADTVARAVEGVHYIFHVAAAYREARLGDDAYRLVHEESTRLLARAANDNPRFKRFIHVSTVGVLGHIDNPPADEQTPYNPGDIYQSTKVEAEKWILDYRRRTGLPLVVVRPAAIYGAEDRRLLKLYKMARMPVIPLIGFSKGLYHLIHVEDLTRFMIFAAEKPGIEGEVYICGNSAPISIKEMIDLIARHLGRTPRFVRIPAAPVFAAAYLCEMVCRILSIEPPIYRRRIAFFTKDRAFDTRKMQRDFDFKYQYTNEQGLKTVCDAYCKNGWL